MFMSTTHVTSMSQMTIEEKPLEIGRLTGSCQAYCGVISTPARRTPPPVNASRGCPVSNGKRPSSSRRLNASSNARSLKHHRRRPNIDETSLWGRLVR